MENIINALTAFGDRNGNLIKKKGASILNAILIM